MDVTASVRSLAQVHMDELVSRIIAERKHVCTTRQLDVGRTFVLSGIHYAPFVCIECSRVVFVPTEGQ